MVKTNIKMQVTPEQSAKIQQICFDSNIYWADFGNEIQTDIEYILIYDKKIYSTSSFTNFTSRPLKEINQELFIATNGSCEGVLVKANGQSFVLGYDEIVRINSTGLPKFGCNPNKTFKIANPIEALDADLMKSTNTESHSIPTTDQFAKYGFQTPDFQCKLYDKLDDYILGAYFNPNKQKWTMCRWGFDGRNKQGSYNYALKPIVINKPWYETCKFPCIIIADYYMPVVVKHYNDGYVYDFRDNKYCVKSWRLFTNDEIEGLKQ